MQIAVFHILAYLLEKKVLEKSSLVISFCIGFMQTED